MSADRLFEKITSKIHTKLEKTTSLNNIPDELRVFLDRLYKESALNSRLTATLFNAIYTDADTELKFLMSTNLLHNLVKKDHEVGNLERSTINSTEYKTFVVLMLKKEIIKIVEPHQEKSPLHQNGIAATWQLIDRDAISIITDNWVNEDGELFKDEDAQFEANQEHSNFLYNEWVENEFTNVVNIDPTLISRKPIFSTEDEEVKKQIAEIKARKSGPLKIY